jgi:Zn finger protein HypA/HybF involved in hydrogenase expression
MKTVTQAIQFGDRIHPKHEIEILCLNCGYDLDESELAAATCSDCGQILNLRQNMKIYATSIPAAKGDAAL